MYLDCTWYVLGMYWYVLVRTWKNKTSRYTATLRAFIPWCYLLLIQGIYKIKSTLASHSTFWLVSDVWRGSRRAPCSGHDVTGQDFDLNFPDAHVDSARDRP
jgi:hypothetical protein